MLGTLAVTYEQSNIQDQDIKSAEGSRGRFQRGDDTGFISHVTLDAKEVFA